LSGSTRTKEPSSSRLRVPARWRCGARDGRLAALGLGRCGHRRGARTVGPARSRVRPLASTQA
jgi:hypothetical protein